MESNFVSDLFEAMGDAEANLRIAEDATIPDLFAELQAVEARSEELAEQAVNIAREQDRLRTRRRVLTEGVVNKAIPGREGGYVLLGEQLYSLYRGPSGVGFNEIGPVLCFNEQKDDGEAEKSG